MKQYFRGLFLLAILIVGLNGIQLWGQADQGTVTGTVLDSQGALISGASVTLENVNTGLILKQMSNSSGGYTFTPIKIGTYSITAVAKGFEATTQTGVVVNVNARLAVNLTLNVGSSTQTITVTTAPPQLQTEDSSLGQVVESKTIVDVPLNGRNPIFIAQLTPGVTPPNQGARGAAKGGDFSANGQRAEQNNFILDGIDNNADLVDIPNGTSYVIKTIPESLQEFKVQTSDYNAEIGRSAGAVVNASIKSGSNAFHGSMWEYSRNDIFDAKDEFDTSIPEYRQNQFGATLGGPFLKNKLFFFGDAEANRIVFGTTGTYTVPTAKMRTGDFTELLSSTLTNSSTRTLYVPGTAGTEVQECNGVVNVICSSQISTLAEKLLNILPSPNKGVSGQTYNNYYFQGKATDNTTQYDVRLDWNISQNDQAFARYSNSNEPMNFPGAFGELGGGSFGSIGNVLDQGRNFTFSETHAFSPALSNEFRFGYNWLHASYLQPYDNEDLSSTLGLGGVPYSALNGGTPYFSMSEISSFGSPQYYPTNENENVFQILDNVSKVWRQHTFKAGINLQRIRIFTLQPEDGRGTYDFTGKYTEVPSSTSDSGFDAADFLLDQMEASSISNIGTTRNQRWYRAAYVQDDWKVSQRLALNLGVRYEYTQPVEELDGKQANFLIDYSGSTETAQYLLPKQDEGNITLPTSFTTALADNNIPIVYTNNKFLTNPDKTRFAPRVGLSYKIDDNTVIRAGFGLFYGGIESVGFWPNLGQNVPFSFESNFTSGSCTTTSCATNGQTLETGFEDALSVGLSTYASVPSARSYPSKIQTPYSEQWNLSLQRSIGLSSAATIAYVGSVGRHLTANPKTNQPPYLLTSGASVEDNRPFSSFGEGSLLSYGSVSNYNSLQATFERHYSNNLAFLATYTWSHTLDDAFLPLGGTGQSGSGYRNWEQLGFYYDYGSSYQDVRQRLSFNATYDLPFGKDKKWLNNRRQVMDMIAGGWSTSLIFRVQTGEPEIVYPSNDPTNGAGSAYAIKVANPYGTSESDPGTGATCSTKVRTTGSWFNPCAFKNPAVATGPDDLASYGTKGRTEIWGPGYNRVDFSAFKAFKLVHNANLQFRADIFNLFNTPAYGQPGNTIGSSFGVITSERFGGSGISGETPDARVVQFSGKVTF